MSYLFIGDAGHGWLRVSREEAESTKLPFSPYSYEKGRYVYLEEDQDALMFADYMDEVDPTWESRMKIRVVDRSTVRGYPPYNCPYFTQEKFDKYFDDRRKRK